MKAVIEGVRTCTLGPSQHCTILSLGTALSPASVALEKYLDVPSKVSNVAERPSQPDGEFSVPLLHKTTDADSIGATEWKIPVNFPELHKTLRDLEPQDSHAFPPSLLPSGIVNFEYAVRGLVPQRAEEIEKDINDGVDYPFNKLVRMNIGNPQGLDQKPLTYYRQCLSALTHPHLLEQSPELFASDVRAFVGKALTSIKSIGAYSHSNGHPFFRLFAEAWLNRRDKFPCDPSSLFLTNGASQGIAILMEMLIRNDKDGVIIPVPQYPLYSAAVTKNGGTALGYHLNEEDNWSVDFEELEKIYTDAVENGVTPRAFVAINPGNPTGTIYSRDTMVRILKFCQEKKLVLLADEVYQENIYNDSEFLSFRKVAHEAGHDMELASFHSTSKGYYGECGFRGGLMYLENFHPDVIAMVAKCCRILPCSNTLGQAMLACVLTPPEEGSPSYAQFNAEKKDILDSMKKKAQFLVKKIREMKGMSCHDAQGAMYLFPRIKLPIAAIAAAAAAEHPPDTYYCLKLLEATGIVTVPGSGFLQKAGTYHLRLTILPSMEDLKDAMVRWHKFHQEFMWTYHA